MKEEYFPLPLVKNEAERRFELTLDGHTAFIEYKEHHNKIWLIHTESPDALAGKGIATALIEKTLAWIEGNHYKLIPICPMVVAYIKRHPEWKRILEEHAAESFK